MKLYDSFIHKSVRARIGIIIAFVLLLFFCFYIIKGNLFSSASPAEISEITTEITAETAEAITEETENSQLQFHIGYLDIALLIGVVTAYGIHKFREKKREERIHR